MEISEWTMTCQMAIKTKEWWHDWTVEEMAAQQASS